MIQIIAILQRVLPSERPVQLPTRRDGDPKFPRSQPRQFADPARSASVAEPVALKAESAGSRSTRTECPESVGRLSLSVGNHSGTASHWNS